MSTAADRFGTHNRRPTFAQYFTERFRGDRLLPGPRSARRHDDGSDDDLIGEADDWTPADRCRDARPEGAPIALTVYPDAHHAFDVAWLQPGRNAFGHWLEYNEPAAKDAEEKVRAFLATHLVETAPGQPIAK